MTARIPAVEPPFAPRAEAVFRLIVPPGHTPLRVARTMVHNPRMAAALSTWHSYELSDAVSVNLREREIVVQRTCARCGCEYQWGVHVAVFSERAELTEAQVCSLVFGTSADPCWRTESDRLLVDLADQLHESSDVDDELWTALGQHFTDEQLLDLIALCGWYHAVCYLTRATRVEPEPGLPSFADVRRHARHRPGA